MADPDNPSTTQVPDLFGIPGLFPEFGSFFLSALPLIGLTWFALKLDFVSIWFCVFAILGLLILMRRWGRFKNSNGADPDWRRLRIFGAIDIFVLLVVTPVAVATLNNPLWWITEDTTVPFLLLLFFFFVVFEKRNHPLNQSVQVMAALLTGPTLWSAFLTSTAYVAFGSIAEWLRRPEDLSALQLVLDERKNRLEKWTGETVAVTLSGGGYRAALAHAGVLSILDKAGIPITYLSTVSGGSIVGAA